MLKVSESYIVGIDISENDEAVVQVATSDGTNMKLVKKFTGPAAIRLYDMLSGKTNYELVSEEMLNSWYTQLNDISQQQLVMLQKLKHIEENYNLIPK